MLDTYLNKNTLIELVKRMPVVDVNGAELVSKERVLKNIQFLPEEEFTTKLRRNVNSQVFCQNCEAILKENSIQARQLTHCPNCNLKISEFKFDVPRNL